MVASVCLLLHQTMAPPDLTLPSLLSDLATLKTNPTLLSSLIDPTSNPTTPHLPLDTTISSSSPEDLTSVAAVNLVNQFLQSSKKFLENSDGVRDGEERLETVRRETEKIRRGLE